MDNRQASAVSVFVVSLSCFFVFLLPSVRGVAALLLFLFASIAFILGSVFSFDERVTVEARFAIAYLTFAAFLHLWVGAIASQDSWGLLVGRVLEDSSVHPIGTLLHVIRACTIDYPCGRTDLWVDLVDDHSYEIAAVSTIVVSFLALAGAIAMMKRRTIGYRIWLVVVVVSTVAGLWMVLANAFISVRGVPLYYDEWVLPVWWKLCLPVTYAIAYWFARRGAELK